MQGENGRRVAATDPCSAGGSGHSRAAIPAPLHKLGLLLRTMEDLNCISL